MLILNLFLFFFNDTATTEIYTLSLHDALPIYWFARSEVLRGAPWLRALTVSHDRSEEHTSELQSPDHLVCRLLLEKKNGTTLLHLPGLPDVTGVVNLSRLPCVSQGVLVAARDA